MNDLIMNTENKQLYTKWLGFMLPNVKANFFMRLSIAETYNNTLFKPINNKYYRKLPVSELPKKVEYRSDSLFRFFSVDTENLISIDGDIFVIGKLDFDLRYSTGKRYYLNQFLNFLGEMKNYSVISKVNVIGDKEMQLYFLIKRSHLKHIGNVRVLVLNEYKDIVINKGESKYIAVNSASDLSKSFLKTFDILKVKETKHSFLSRDLKLYEYLIPESNFLSTMKYLQSI